MEKCKFLTEKGICQIGQLGLHNVEQENSRLAFLTEEVKNPSHAFPCNGQANVEGSNTVITMLVMTCSAKNDASEQEKCDTFVPEIGWIEQRKIWEHWRP